MLSVAPPHTVASLKSRIVKIEGTILYQNMQIFKDIDGEELMNDKDHLSFQADTYPGCEEDDPIAIVCGETPVNQEEKERTFSKSIRVKARWGMSLYFDCMSDRAVLTWLDSGWPSGKVAPSCAKWWCIENRWCQDIWDPWQRLYRYFSLGELEKLCWCRVLSSLPLQWLYCDECCWNRWLWVIASYQGISFLNQKHSFGQSSMKVSDPLIWM